MGEKILRRKIEVVEVIMIDEIMTPIAAMLIGNKIVALLSGRVFIGHFSAYSMDYCGKGEADIIGADTFLSG